MVKMLLWRIQGIGIEREHDIETPETIVDLNKFIPELNQHESIKKECIVFRGGIHFPHRQGKELTPKNQWAELRTGHMTSLTFRLNLSDSISYEIRFIYDINPKGHLPIGHHWNLGIDRLVSGEKDKNFKIKKKDLPHISIPGYENMKGTYSITGDKFPGIDMLIVSDSNKFLKMKSFY